MEPLTVDEMIGLLMKLPKNALLIYASDEEGNNFNGLFCEPSEMVLDDIRDRYNGDTDSLEGKKIVCIN